MTKLLTHTMQSHNLYISFFPQYCKSLLSHVIFFIVVGIHSHRGDKYATSPSAASLLQLCSQAYLTIDSWGRMHAGMA